MQSPALTRSFFFFFQAEDGIRDLTVTGVQTCALPILARLVGNGQAVLTRVHTDTRTLQAGDLFVALKGERFDANQFLAQAREAGAAAARSEEHTSELQSQSNLVCRLLLEKKNKNKRYTTHAGDKTIRS